MKKNTRFYFTDNPSYPTDEVFKVIELIDGDLMCETSRFPSVKHCFPRYEEVGLYGYEIKVLKEGEVPKKVRKKKLLERQTRKMER